MNKFVKTLSASDANIKETRATILAEQASIEADTLVQNLKKEKLSLQSKISQMTDLAPESTFSLRPGGDNFDAAKWVKELHKTRLELKLKEVELAEAETIRNEWFAEDKTSK